MPLGAGTRIGPYTIDAPLGSGGMGEVYRARDTKLNRDVAIKVLPDSFAMDPERLARFSREAQTLAALNHPNIAQVYALETSSGLNGLVMELVDGEDLSAVIARGAVPVTDVLPIARQIADALEAAHEAGIVHRDLKPANVKVRSDGTVKVLDFGLAKAMDPTGGSSIDPMNSPTLTVRGTQLGVILGTAAYMAPEQARGKIVDKRADIWAFGVVLYEMLSGRRAFEGAEISDILAAVLRQDIDWTALPSSLPRRLRRLIERCLDRDPKTRLRDIGEARIEIAALEAGAPDVPTVAAPPSRRATARELLAWGMAAVGVLAASGLWIVHSREPSTTVSDRVVRLPFVPPRNVVGEAGGAVISPDGQKIVFSGRAADGRRLLWLRRLDSLEATPLPDTQDAIEPFWSPNSRSIAFGAQGKLKRLDIGDARARVIGDAARSNNGTWSPSGTIVFSPDFRAPLVRISADGGPRTTVTKLVEGLGSHRYPHFLPDGRHFLYWSGRESGAAIVVGDVDSSESKQLLPEFGPAVYANPGWLIYFRNGTLVAHAFDAGRLELSGEPIPLPAPALGGTWDRGGRVSVSETGVLMLQDASQYDYELAWFDRTGRRASALGPVRNVTVAEFPRVSPDGARVILQIFDPVERNNDLWLGDVARGTIDRFTTNPALEQLGLWSLDGRSVFCSTFRNGVNGIYQIPVGGGDARLIVRGTVFPADLSSDGKSLFFLQRGETTRSDIWVQPMAPDGSAAAGQSPRAVVHSEAEELQAHVSPDGGWLAYSSDVTGTSEIYVRRLTGDGAVSEPTRVSREGGTQARWSRDGRELFFVNASQGSLAAQFMSVAVKHGESAFEYSEAIPLFKARMAPFPGVVRDYDVSPDGQRFLVGTVVGDAAAAPATIMLNWMAGLKR